MRLPRPVRLTIFFAVVAAIIAGIFLGIRALLGSGAKVGVTQRAPAELGETILPFGEGYLASDGLTVRCFGPGNKSEPRWTPYSPDSHEREVTASDKLIAMWREDSLHVLDASGNVKFNRTLDSSIDLVRCGNEKVIAYMPQQNNARVLTMDGEHVLDISTAGYTVMDAGFFTDQDLLWILFLNSQGSTPSTVLRTYQPTRDETGGHTFDDQVIYDVLYNDNKLYATGTREVSIINLATGDTDAKRPLVYGWQLIDRAVISKTDAGLLFTLSGESANGTPERLKVVRGDGTESEISLPSGCLGAYIGSKGVWGVSAGTIYAYPFGAAAVEYALDYTIEEVVQKLSGNRLMVKVGAEMHLLTLP